MKVFSDGQAAAATIVAIAAQYQRRVVRLDLHAAVYVGPPHGSQYPNQ
jgi:hypothetical protein